MADINPAGSKTNRKPAKRDTGKQRVLRLVDRPRRKRNPTGATSSARPIRERRVRPLKLALNTPPVTPVSQARVEEHRRAFREMQSAWAFNEFEYLKHTGDASCIERLFFKWSAFGWVREEKETMLAALAPHAKLISNYGTPAGQCLLDLLKRPLNDSEHSEIINGETGTDHLVAFQNAVYSTLSGELVDEDPLNVLAYAPLIADRSRGLWPNLPAALTTLAKSQMFGSIGRLLKPIPERELQRVFPPVRIAEVQAARG